MSIEETPESFEYTLKTPIHHPQGGTKIEASTITVHCPKGRQVVKSHRLEQLLTRAMYQSQGLLMEMLKGRPTNNTPAEGDQGFTADSVALFLRGSDVDLEEALGVFSTLALDGCITVYERNINPVQWNELHVEDELGIFYKFCAVFIMPSAFPQTETTEKEPEEGNQEELSKN